MKCPTPKTHSVYITGVNSCCDRPRELIHNPYYVCKRPQDITASLFPLHTGLHSVPTAHWAGFCGFGFCDPSGSLPHGNVRSREKDWWGSDKAGQVKLQVWNVLLWSLLSLPMSTAEVNRWRDRCRKTESKEKYGGKLQANFPDENREVLSKCMEPERS